MPELPSDPARLTDRRAGRHHGEDSSDAVEISQRRGILHLRPLEHATCHYQPYLSPETQIIIFTNARI